MTGKHTLKRRLNEQSIKKPKKFPYNNLHKRSPPAGRHICSIKLSRQASLRRSRSPVDHNKRKSRNKFDNSEALSTSGSVYSGSHIGKIRRRETRNSVSEPIPESSSTSSNLVDSTKARRHQIEHSEMNKSSTDDMNMAPSSSHGPSARESSRTCLPSTSHGKRNTSWLKDTSNSPPVDMPRPRDSGVLLTDDSTFQSIMSRGMDISHLQDYLSSRSMTSRDTGEKVNKKLDNLRAAAGDRTQEYSLMSDINQHLLVSYEDSLSSLRVAELVNHVVGIIDNCEDNFVDLKNICYNVLLHLMEAIPRSSDCLVEFLAMFLYKLSNLFDFDSLEQIINVIERVSRRHGHAVLQCGAFTIIFNYYDFLTATQQLTVLNMISQCFDNLKPADFNFVIDGIENLSNRLRQSEPKCVEKVIQCFVRLVTAFQGDEAQLKKLVSSSLLANLADLLISSPPIVSDIHVIVHMMAVMCVNCPDIALDLIRQNITQTIRTVCIKHNTRSAEEILSLVNLISEMLPPLPFGDDLFIVNRLIENCSLSRQCMAQHDWLWFDQSRHQWVSHPQDVCQSLDKALHGNEFEVRCQSINVDLVTMEQTHSLNGVMVTSDIRHSEHQTGQSRVDPRERLLQDNLVAIDLMHHLFPLLIDIYNEASSLRVRYKCLEGMIRMIYHITNEVLDTFLDKTSLSSLMATLLASNDSIIIINSIQLGTIIKKLPSSLIFNLKKEGVLHQLDQTLSLWRSRTLDLSAIRDPSICQLPEDSLVSVQLASDHLSDWANTANRRFPNGHFDIVKHDESMDRFPDFAQLPTTGHTSHSKHKFTNWIMKRSGFGSRHTSSDDISQINSKSRKQRLELEHAWDADAKGSAEPTNSSTNAANNHRFNQIMRMLNLNSPLSNLCHQYENKADKSYHDSKKRELFYKRWILKFGTRLNSDWSHIGDDSLDEMSPMSAACEQKKDVVCYLREIANGLRVDCSSSNKKAIMLLAELLSTDCYISVFEMESSSINEALLDFFTRLASTKSRRDNLLMFLDIFVSNASDSRSPFLSLVTHLLACLHQQEQFSVRTCQLPINSNIDSRNIRQSRFSLSQGHTDASRGSDNTFGNVESSMFERGVFPNWLLEHSSSRSGNKPTEVQCSLSPYKSGTHATDAENGVEFWSGEDLLGFNTSFKVTLDVLATISSIEKIVMEELSGHRRLHRRLGIMSKELASLNDSSESDENYGCDVMNESYLGGDFDVSDFLDSPVRKHSSAGKSSSKSATKKSLCKRSSLLKSTSSTSSKSSSKNLLSKFRDSGQKALTNRQLQLDPDCMMGPSISSAVSDLHGKYSLEAVFRPMSKIQILIEDMVLPQNMTLYQAIRRYNSHVVKLMEGRTEQEMEEAINHLIWKCPHKIHFRPVCSTSDNISTVNIASPCSADASISLAATLQTPFVGTSEVSTRQRSLHRLPTASDIDWSAGLPHSRYKRRRKSHHDTNPKIGRSAAKSHESFFSNLSRDLPYPTLIDFPSVLESVPVSKMQRSNNPCVKEPSADHGTPHHDLNSNMSQKLQTTLALLRCLYSINGNYHDLAFSLSSSPIISETEFRSQKLSAKVNRQFQETFYVLARNIPFWCVQLLHTCAFLFSLETRQNFLYLFNFDRARTLLYLEGAVTQDSDTSLDSSSDIRRVRVKVNRSDRLLDESELLLKSYSDSHTLLEISFNNEAGFGLGPTNEFYTQVSRCLMKSDLMMWYSSAESNDEYVTPPPLGLFPRPIQCRNKKLDTKTRNKFLFLGRFMARALLDCRKIDLPLNPIFYKWLLGQQETINIAEMAHIDPCLAGQLRSLHDIVEKKLRIDGEAGLSAVGKEEAFKRLGVEDLQIVFVHPMYTDIELVKGGINRVVTIHDLSLYLDLVACSTLLEGVRSQMGCVLEGFDSLLPGARSHLAALFEAHELEEIFCGGGVEDKQAWDVKTLNECLVCDHGYTMNSRSIVNLFEIMSEFSKEQRRHFVQFCTGTPRLPVGGFRALRPPFKIVNKKEGGDKADSYLPSVMTCQNFLKLPDYSSKEVMRERLLYALQEGQNAFFLS